MVIKVAVDFIEYINSLGEEKYRSSIIIAKPKSGKTTFAMKAAEILNGRYIDFLDLFLKNEALVSAIDSFGPDSFFKLLEKEIKGERFVAIDHLDFLLDTWRDQEVKSFIRGIKQQWNSFLENYRATVCYFLQPSSRLSNLEVSDSQGRPRVNQLSNFKLLI